MILRTFAGSFTVAAAGLACGFLYGGGTGLVIVAILAVLEVSLSFDNAVVNARVLVRMNRFWQTIFLTVGVAIAVFGMRLVFPMLIVGVTAQLGPIDALNLALEGGDPDTPGTYGYLLHQAHPTIAAFGGAFLLMVFLDFVLEERELTWLSWLERPLAKIGKLDQVAVVFTAGAICASAYLLAPEDKVSTVLFSGILGLITYVAVHGLGELFNTEDEDAEDDDEHESVRDHSVGRAAGRAAFFLFMYLEVLDASFSFDGVIGAFAITSDPIIIAIGLGIGAMFIRSLTVLLVRKGTLAEYEYLEHGALWAIGALAVILLLTMRYEVPEVVTGLIGVAFILSALVCSIVRNRRGTAQASEIEIETARV